MAHQPCDLCGSPFFGRSSYAYPAFMHNGDRESRRIRCCPKCMQTYVGWIESRLSRWNKGDVYGPELQMCAYSEAHDQDAPSASTLFVTLYPVKDQRQDWAAGVCHDHAGRLAAESHVKAL
jgi:hypothetical protein